MKMKILIPGIFILLVILKALSGCEKYELADEDTVISVRMPSISVYKTRKDYFDKVTVKYTDGEITQTPGYTPTCSRIFIDDNGNVSFTNRWRLINGYVLSREFYLNHSFTNVSIQEFIDTYEKIFPPGWDTQKLEPRVVDKDPFISYYYCEWKNCKKDEFTIGELNRMIKNGMLEQYFDKLK